MNVGQALGELQLQIARFEESAGGAAVATSDHEAADLRAKLIAAKERARIAEQKLAGAYQRIQKLERGDAQDRLKTDDIVATIKAECDAKLRGKDQQISDWQRTADAERQERVSLQRQCGQLSARVLALEAELAKARDRQPDPVATAPVAECPTCSPIVRAIARAVRSRSPATPPRPRMSRLRRHVTQALEQAAAPMSAQQIATATDEEKKSVYAVLGTFLRMSPPMVVQVGRPGVRHMHGYRYWLASRPLPEGVNLEGGRTC